MRLGPDATPEAPIVPTLDMPTEWHPCPVCGREYPVEVEVRCWECDRAEERARARAAALVRAGLVGPVGERDVEDEWVCKLLRFPSSGKLRSSILRMLSRTTRSAAITITGGTGTGKTTLAVLLAKARLSGALFTRSTSLCAADAQHALGRGEADMIARARGAHLLVIDELKVPSIAARRDVLEELLWDRTDRGLLTVVTHGWSEEQIIQDWGVGTHRRLYTDAQHVDLGERQ